MSTTLEDDVDAVPVVLVRDVKVKLASLYLDGEISQDQANKIAQSLGVGPIYHVDEAIILMKVRITSTSSEDHPKNVEEFINLLKNVDTLWKHPLHAGIPAELIEVTEDIEPF